MNPPGSGYFVSLSDAVREQVLAAARAAATDGRAELFRAALRVVTRRLQTNPTEFGEEVFDLRAMRLTVKVAAVFPIAVEFAVHAEQRVVFVRTFRYITPAISPPSNGHVNGTG